MRIASKNVIGVLGTCILSTLIVGCGSTDEVSKNTNKTVHKIVKENVIDERLTSKSSISDKKFKEILGKKLNDKVYNLSQVNNIERYEYKEDKDKLLQDLKVMKHSVKGIDKILEDTRSKYELSGEQQKALKSAEDMARNYNKLYLKGLKVKGIEKSKEIKESLVKYALVYNDARRSLSIYKQTIK